jgi:hypothetical protein
MAKQSFSSDSDFKPNYIDQNLNFTNSRVDEWKLNVIKIDEESLSDGRRFSALKNKTSGNLHINRQKVN